MATELGSRARLARRGGASQAHRAHELAVDVRDVSRTFTDRRGASDRALAGVSLHAERGELLAVVGPSGCGKTTLLELICGLQEPDSGPRCDRRH